MQPTWTKSARNCWSQGPACLGGNTLLADSTLLRCIPSGGDVGSCFIQGGMVR